MYQIFFKNIFVFVQFQSNQQISSTLKSGNPPATSSKVQQGNSHPRSSSQPSTLPQVSNRPQNVNKNPPHNFVSAMTVLDAVQPIRKTMNPPQALMNIQFLKQLNENDGPRPNTLFRFGVNSQPQKSNAINQPYNRNNANANVTNYIPSCLSNVRNDICQSKEINSSSMKKSTACDNQQNNNLNCISKSVSNKNIQNKVNLNIPTRSSPRNTSSTPNRFKKIAEKLATSVIEILDSPGIKIISCSILNKCFTFIS